MSVILPWFRYIGLIFPIRLDFSISYLLYSSPSLGWCFIGMVVWLLTLTHFRWGAEECLVKLWTWQFLLCSLVMLLTCRKWLINSSFSELTAKDKQVELSFMYFWRGRAQKWVPKARQFELLPGSPGEIPLCHLPQCWGRLAGLSSEDLNGDVWKPKETKETVWYWGNTFSTFLMFSSLGQKPFTNTPGISPLSFLSLSPRCREQPPGSATFHTFQRGTPHKLEIYSFPWIIMIRWWVIQFWTSC